MLETQPCAALLADELTQAYAFFKSDTGELLLAAIATVKAIIYYCIHSRYREAKELGSAMIAGLALALLIIAEESPAPIVVKQVLNCKAPQNEGPVLSQSLARR